VEQGTDQKNDSGDDGNPVQLTQRASDNIPGEMSRGQNRESRRSKHESEKD
jgi:hypothetical protein